MKIAIEGCAHGELERIYDSIALIEEREGVKVDLLICCGDFQSTRNLDDLKCMAVPPTYQHMCSFYKYYSGEKVAPILTVFVGGNHEASNYLQELSYGGWVAPNIYYLGNAGVINIAGIRIAGISGIYKGHDYNKGRFEIAPYNNNTKRSVYHIRNLDVFRLKQLTNKIDIFLSHDWPRGVYNHGDAKQLLRHKPFFREEVESNKLGSPPCEDLLHFLKPKYWFAAHLHTKFAAVVPHDKTEESDNDIDSTKFLALDKCLPQRRFLQILDFQHDTTKNIEIEYDLEWLTILHLTNHLMSVKESLNFMPGKGSPQRWIFTPTEEERELIFKRIGENLKVPLNFKQTVTPYNPQSPRKSNGLPTAQINAQTVAICNNLNIDDPIALLLMYNSGKMNINFSLNSSCDLSSSYTDVSNSITDGSFDSSQVSVGKDDVRVRSSLTLPNPKSEEIDLSDGLIDDDSDLLNDEEYYLNSNKKRVSPVMQDHKPEEIMKDVDVIIESESKKNNLVISSAKKFKRRNEQIYTSLTEDVY